MPYVGRDLQRGNYLKLDDISSSFNGSLTTFNLTSGGNAFFPGSAFSIIVSLGGVIQEPEAAFQIDRSQIIFATAPSPNDDFFCIVQGVALGVGVPGHNTVGNDHLAKPLSYGDYFRWDSANNRVGINTLLPSTALDVVGSATFSGNVSIGGTLTYEDVANIDAVGIITARAGIEDKTLTAGRVVYTGTGGRLVDNSGLTFNPTTLGVPGLSVAGVSTFSDIIAGIVTISHTGANQLTIKDSDTSGNGSSMRISFKDSGNTERFYIGNDESSNSYLYLGSPSGQNNNVALTVGGSTKLTAFSGGIGVNGDLELQDTIYHAGDTDTKIRFPGADQIQLETAGSNRLNIGSTGNVTIGNNTDTGTKVYVKNSNDDANNTNSLALDIQGAWIRIGDAILGNETYSNGIGIKFHNSGTAHHSISAQGQDLYFSTTSNNGNQLWPSSRTDSLRLTGAGAAIFASDITAGGNIYMPDKMYHVNDTDTYLHFDTNTINLHAGGTTGLSVLDSSVRVPTKLGINGAAPQTPLDVIANGSGYAMAIRGRSSDDTADVRFTSNDYGSIYAQIIGGPTYLKFATGGSNRWQMDSDGHLLPATAGAVNIGSASVEIGDVYLADGKSVYLGSGQDVRMFYDASGSSSFTIDSQAGYTYINSDALRLNSRTSSWNYLRGDKSDGVVKLYKSNSERLATSDAGITVTGEVAASQDYPDFKPSLDFNFASTKKLDSRISFARQGTASYYDEFGKVKFAADNEPRFDHDPDTGECKGLLIESSSANLIGGSADEGSDTRAVNSTLGNGFAINELVSDIIRPTGTPGLVRRVKSHASGNSGGRWGGYNGSGGSPYAGSFWVRSVTGTSQVGIDVNDMGYNATTVGTEWVRVKAEGTTSSNYDFMDITFPNTSDDVYIWGIQLEQNEYASSYIRNSKNSSQAYRGADIANIDGEEFAEFYNDTEHTTVMVGQRAGNEGGSDGRLYTISDGTSSQVAPDWDFDDGTHLRFSTNVGGSTQTLQSITSWSGINEEFKIAAGIALNNQIGVVNGTAIAAADTSCAMPTGVDRLFFGLRGNGGNQGSLTIKRFMFYPKRLPDSQLVTLTS